jgi:hypothetical protein
MRLVNFLREHPFSTAIRTKVETNFPGSIRTSRKRIKESELRNPSAANKIFLSEANKEERLRFAFQYTGCPRTGSPEKKGSLRANILTCILKKKSPISNDNREKTF